MDSHLNKTEYRSRIFNVEIEQEKIVMDREKRVFIEM